jgi:hypothetical protein
MGTSIGSTPYGSLSQKVSDLELLPESLALTHGDTTVRRTLAEVGIRKDVQRTVQSADQQRFLLPIVNLFKSPALQAPITIDKSKQETAIRELSSTFHTDPTNARLALAGTNVTLVEAKNGYDLDQAALPGRIIAALDANKTTVPVAVKITQPKVTAADLQDDKQGVEQQLGVSVTYTYNGRNKQASREDIAKWFVPAGESLTVSPDAVRNYIVQAGSSFGIRVKDINQAVTATEQALANRKAVSVALTAQVAAKTFAYCTAAKGVDAAHLPAFRAKLKSTFADTRGWSINGLVAFQEASSGCNFTVWLTAAELMPTFGAICDSMWSCRVGPNVVINFDRWQNASPAWNANGGTIEEYRHMVINHETGHWLSFGHSHCTGAGQPAPVMQQQSIDLQGCSFNAWPTSGELATLRQKLGI